jgi:hypothetical protein
LQIVLNPDADDVPVFFHPRGQNLIARRQIATKIRKNCSNSCD